MGIQYLAEAYLWAEQLDRAIYYNYEQLYSTMVCDFKSIIEYKCQPSGYVNGRTYIIRKLWNTIQVVSEQNIQIEREKEQKCLRLR